MSRKNRKDTEDQEEKEVEEEIEDQEEDIKEEVEDPEEENGDVQPSKRSRRRITKEIVLEDLDALISKIDAQIEKLRKTMNGQSGSRFLRGVKNRLVRIRKDTVRMKKRRAYRPDATIYEMSDDLADFLSLDRGSTISRLDLQWAISAYIHVSEDEDREGILKWKHLNKGRDLRDPNDRKIILPNSKLKKLLDYDEYRRAVKRGDVKIRNRDRTYRTYEDDTLRYWVIMKLLQPHLAKI